MHVSIKYTLCLLLALNTFSGFCQNKLPVVKASSPQAKIYEQNDPPSNWHINPKLKLDVHTTGKLTGKTIVRFVTDIDSISLPLAPGQQRDLIILLNGKDSCLTRIQSPAVKDLSMLPEPIHDTVPFVLNRFNTNLVRVVFNHTDTLQLNFDTGATEVSFTAEALAKKIRSNPELYSRLYDITIGHHAYRSKVYDIQLAGNEVDGLLGWDMFDGMIVELDHDHHRLVLHSRMPKAILKDPRYSKFKIRYIRNKPFIESEIMQGDVKSKNWFMFDLGYQRTVMLDNDLLQRSGFPVDKMKVIKKVILHGTHNNEVPVITASLQTLKMGKIRLTDVPVQIMSGNKPLPGANVHILGTDVLKRFNTVIDLQHNLIYLKPNGLYDTAYADQGKGG